MDLYIANKHLDAQIEKIQQKIRLSMNGVTSESMTEKGVFYKKNYGVEFPVLREIAKSFESSHDLANRLWLIGWRETLILSILLQPTDGFTTEKAIERIISAPQKEIIDILCQFLLSKADFAPALTIQLISKHNENCRIAGFMLASRIYSHLTQNQITELIQISVELSDTDNYKLYKSIGICLGRLCRTNGNNAISISKAVENFMISEKPSQRSIANEVKQELDFLDNLFDK